MSKLSLVKGTTSYRAYVFIGDSSVSTGAGLTGLLFNTASLVASYVRPGAARTAITLATQTVTGAYSSGGFVEVDATNMPGIYRLDVPDAALATGVNAVVVMLKGAANMAPCVFEIELTATDQQDAVRGGMTALPNAAAEAAGGLYTRGTGAGQINQPANGLIDANTLRWNGTAVATPATAGIPDVNVKNIDNDATSASGTVTFPNATLASTTNITAGTITTATNLTTNNDKTGYSLSAAAIQAIWDALTSALTTVGSIGKRIADNLDTTISSRSTFAGGAVASVTGNVGGNVTGSVGSIATGGIAAASFAAGAIDAAAIATDAIGSAELAASAITEIQSGLATSAALTTAQSDLDDIQTRIPAALVSGRMDSSVGAIAANAITAASMAADASAEIADQVWDEVLAGHLTGGSTGAALNAAGSAGDPWSTALPGAYGAGTAGKIVGDNVNATISSRSSHTAADIWAVATRLLTAGTNIVLAKGVGVTGFNDLSAAQVNTEVDTALATDTYAEPGSVPAATSSIKDKIGWLFTLARNKRTTTSTTDTVRNDADTVSIATSTISDDGTTFTRGEYT